MRILKSSKTFFSIEFPIDWKNDSYFWQKNVKFQHLWAARGEALGMRWRLCTTYSLDRHKIFFINIFSFFFNYILRIIFLCGWPVARGAGGLGPPSGALCPSLSGKFLIKQRSPFNDSSYSQKNFALTAILLWLQTWPVARPLLSTFCIKSWLIKGLHFASKVFVEKRKSIILTQTSFFVISPFARFLAPPPQKKLLTDTLISFERE